MRMQMTHFKLTEKGMIEAQHAHDFTFTAVKVNTCFGQCVGVADILASHLTREGYDYKLCKSSGVRFTLRSSFGRAVY